MKPHTNILDTIHRAVQRPRVLIVEDNYLIAVEVGRNPKDYGCDVVGPEVTVAAALKILGCAKIDIASWILFSKTIRQNDYSTISICGASLSPSARGLTSRRCIHILRY